MVESLNDGTFASAISNGLSVVDFWAAWCGPCKMMEPILANASENMTSVKFYKVNIDEFPKLAASNNIMSIPTLIVFKDGKSVGNIVGAMSQEKLTQVLSEFTETSN